MTSPEILIPLITEIKRKNCVLFVGAGLARGAGLPDWEGLLLKLIELGKGFGVVFSDEAALIDLIKGANKNYLTAADAIEKTLNPKLLSQILTEIFRNEDVVPNDTYRLLPAIPFVSVITTNYDKLLEITYSPVIKSHPVIVNNNNVSALHSTLSRGVFYILKAHGDIDQPETIVLGRRSYQELLHNNPSYIDHLKTVFKTRTVLFVGFGMNDPDLELLLDKESVVNKGFANIHYALMDQTTLNPYRREELFRDYNIQTIPYEPSDDTHPEVKDFLMRLSRQTEIVAASDNSSSKPAIADSETRNLAEAIPDSPKMNGEILSGTSQIIKILDALRELVGNENFVIENFDALRLQLLATTLVARHIPDSMLGNHEANNLYLHREKLLTQSVETMEILRMLINDEDGYIPGWYWLNYLKDDLLDHLILKIAVSDPNSSVRENAFNLLTAARIMPPEGCKDSLAWTIVNDSSPDVRKACLSYIGRIGDQEYLSLAGSGLVGADRSVGGEANLSKYLILARINPDRALDGLLAESALKFDAAVEELTPKANEIKSDTLIKALTHANDEIRFLAAEELTARGQLNYETAAKLKEDNYDPVKTIAYRFLVENDENRPEPDDIRLVPDNYLERHWSRNSSFSEKSYIDREPIVLKYYEKYDSGELKAWLDWNNFFAPDVYLSLACDRFAEFGEQLRDDLRNDFKAPAEEYFKHQVEQYKKRNTPEKNILLTAISWGRRKQSTPEEDAAQSVASEKEKYIRAALAGLAKNGTSADVEFGRRFLFHTNSDVSLEAVKILQKWGDETDLSDLIKIAKSSDALLQELAAQTALSITGSELTVAEELLSTENEILASIAIAKLISMSDKKTVNDFLKEKRYLYSPNAGIRMRILAFYIFENEHEKLPRLLNEYTSAETYYYDVVCCLDRVIYAPTKIQLAFRQSLKDKFFGFLTFEDGFLKIVEEESNRKQIFDDLIEVLRNKNSVE